MLKLLIGFNKSVIPLKISRIITKRIVKVWIVDSKNNKKMQRTKNNKDNFEEK